MARSLPREHYDMTYRQARRIASRRTVLPSPMVAHVPPSQSSSFAHSTAQTLPDGMRAAPSHQFTTHDSVEPQSKAEEHGLDNGRSEQPSNSNAATTSVLMSSSVGRTPSGRQMTGCSGA
jgi:hypothetical protein